MRPISVRIVASALLVACGDTNRAQTGVANTGDSRDFEIIDGVISADSNEYGLGASFFLVHGEEESDADLTRATGSICVRGELLQVVDGDYAHNFGISLGFTPGPSEHRTVTETTLSVSPGAPPWELGGRVLGIAATISGRAGDFINFAASPGGQDPGAQYGARLDQTNYINCGGGVLPTSSEQVLRVLFGDLYNGWCVPQVRQKWNATSVSSFGWSLGSRVVASEADLGAPDPYDFCLSNIRPILANEAADEPTLRAE